MIVLFYHVTSIQFNLRNKYDNQIIYLLLDLRWYCQMLLDGYCMQFVLVQTLLRMRLDTFRNNLYQREKSQHLKKSPYFIEFSCFQYI